MITLETITEPKSAKVVEIVWRNPKRLHPHPRRHKVESTGEQKRYVLEEFVGDGYIGFWMAISNLEVMAGGQAA